MAEKQGFWSSIVNGDERSQGLRDLRNQETELQRKYREDIDANFKEEMNLRKKMNKLPTGDREDIHNLITDLKKQKQIIKARYKSEKSLLKDEVKNYISETSSIRKEKNRTEKEILAETNVEFKESLKAIPEIFKDSIKEAKKGLQESKVDGWEKEKQRLIEKGYSEKGIEEAKFHWDKPMWQKMEESYTGQKRMPDYEKSQTTNRTLGSIKLEHLGGHPRVKKGNVTIKAGKESGTLQFGSRSIMVTGMGWEEKGKRSGGKAAAGAVVGGIVTAPITWGAGAIVGAAIGGRKKDDSVVAIAFSDGSVNYTMYLKADAKEYQKLCKLLA
ncbi:hypothetical protein [Shouchella miscanthi]|uniref:hypothetical protein n=1 Tax=Shouchella miscanthi TaxID=2598861 RepID=UPI0011A9A2E0|nr:hypothetical protein [Shouchella miscanthi]